MLLNYMLLTLLRSCSLLDSTSCLCKFGDPASVHVCKYYDTLRVPTGHDLRLSGLQLMKL